MQSVFQEKFSYTMVVRVLLLERSVMVHLMRAIAVANEMGRGGLSVVVAADFSRS